MTSVVDGKNSDEPIVAEFEVLKQNPQLAAGKPFTNLQCQATATNLPEAVAYSVVAANADSSILLATKPICDAKTLPWVVGNAGSLLSDELVVLKEGKVVEAGSVQAVMSEPTHEYTRSLLAALPRMRRPSRVHASV